MAASASQGAKIVSHLPVLVTEVMEQLQPQAGNTLLDATLGHGGHAKAYLESTAPDGRVIGLDADAAALAQAKGNLAVYGDRVQFIHANFAQLNDALKGGGIIEPGKSTLKNLPPGSTQRSPKGEVGIDHILFDLGVGSHQLSDTERGFSFSATAGLSMRYGDQATLPEAKVAGINRVERELNRLPDVADLLQRLKADELAEVLQVYGEERYARRIANVLHDEPLPANPTELAERISQAVPGSYRHGRIHPATRSFQALRLSVNRELEALEAALPQAIELLEPGGIIVVISFHSLEDRIVKQFFRKATGQCICPLEQPICTCNQRATLKILTKKPLRATESEITDNPRARSAKLRAAQKEATERG